MSKEEYELEQLADQLNLEVLRDDKATGNGPTYFYRVTEKGLSQLPANWNNEPVGPFGSYLEALKAATQD